MKKRILKQLTLNKETIASMNRTEMHESFGGAKVSRIGNTCYTGRCCHSRKVCFNITDGDEDGIGLGHGHGNGSGHCNGHGHDHDDD